MWWVDPLPYTPLVCLKDVHKCMTLIIVFTKIPRKHVLQQFDNIIFDTNEQLYVAIDEIN